MINEIWASNTEDDYSNTKVKNASECKLVRVLGVKARVFIQRLFEPNTPIRDLGY
jgi:hypothetical protein